MPGQDFDYIKVFKNAIWYEKCTFHISSGYCFGREKSYSAYIDDIADLLCVGAP